MESVPNDAWILSNYGVFLQNVRQNHDEAEVMYKRAVEADPNHAMALNNLAISLIQNNTSAKRILEAEERVNKILNLKPGHSNALAMLDLISTYKSQHEVSIRLALRQRGKNESKSKNADSESSEVSQDAVDAANKMAELLLSEEKTTDKKKGKKGGNGKGNNKGNNNNKSSGGGRKK